MGLGARARRLQTWRGSHGESEAPSQGLVWSTPVVVVDDSLVGPGQCIVADFTILEFRWPGDADIAETRERIAEGPEDSGVVYAWNGARIGTVTIGRKGGVHLRFAWPDGLARSAPMAARR